MKYDIIKLPPNRVRRNYKGGAGIDKFHGRNNCIDTNQPEEWIGSLISANNQGMEFVKDEGLAFVYINNKKVLLKDIIMEDPKFYLGKEFIDRTDSIMGFLVKILDSSMRLHVQAHPTADFARKYLNSPHGKLECYYILDVRENIKPYIRLGFQHPPEREEWKRIIEEQDIVAMDNCFEKIPVEIGQVWYIPGGLPHAIGEGITMLEIMEPSDLVVRCEFNREGLEIPPEARFMGRGIDFCLDIFDYTKYSVDDIRKKCLIKPKVLEVNNQYKIEQLIGKDITSFFEVRRIIISKKMNYRKAVMPQIGIVCKGVIKIITNTNKLILKKGDSFFLAASLEYCIIENIGMEDVEICFIF